MKGVSRHSRAFSNVSELQYIGKCICVGKYICVNVLRHPQFI